MFVKETSNIFSSFVTPKTRFFRPEWGDRSVVSCFLEVDHKPFTDFRLLYSSCCSYSIAVSMCQPFFFHEATWHSRPCTIHCWWLLAVGIQSVPSCSFWPDSSAGHARTNVGCMFIMIGGSIHPILVSRSLYLHHIASSRRIHIFFTRVSKGTNSIRVSYFHPSHEKYLWKLHTILFTYFPAWSTKHSLSN